MLGEIIAVTLILSMFLGALWLFITISKILDTSICSICYSCQTTAEECPYSGRDYIIVHDCPCYEG